MSQKKILTHVKRILKRNADECRKELDLLEQNLKNPTIKWYQVNICSAWEREGEQSIRNRGKDLEKTLKAAIHKFQKVNKRSDIQGHIIVRVGLNRVNYVIPEKLYEHITLKYLGNGGMNG